MSHRMTVWIIIVSGTVLFSLLRQDRVTGGEADNDGMAIVPQEEIVSRLLEITQGTDPSVEVGTRGRVDSEQNTLESSASGTRLLGESYIRFDPHSTEITGHSSEQLDKVAQAVVSPDLNGIEYVIMGHTVRPGVSASSDRPSDMKTAQNRTGRVEFKVMAQREGGIAYRKRNETVERKLSPGEALNTEDEIVFRFSFSRHDDLYVYIVYRDDPDRVSQVFPEETRGEILALPVQECRMSDDENRWFSLEQADGIDDFLVVAALQPIDSEELVREVQGLFSPSAISGLPEHEGRGP